MSGFCIENEGVEKRLVYRMETDEFIDSFSYSMIVDNEIEGLLPIITSGRNGIEEIRYDLQSAISLRSYLESSMSRRRLLELFRGIINVISSVSMYLLDSSMLVFNLDSIYIDGSPLKVSMVYLPVIGRDMQCDVNENVRNLFRTVIISSQFIVENDNSYITELLNALNSEQEYSVQSMYKLLDKLNLNIHKRCPSGEVSDSIIGKSICESSIRDEAVSDNNTHIGKDSGIVQFGDYRCQENEADTEHIIHEEAASADKNNKEPKGVLLRFTDMLRGFIGSDRKEETGNNDTECYSDIVDFERYASDVKPLCVCEDDSISQDTVLLRSTPADSNIPYLCRVSNNEMIGIDREVFRIGKDERYADYRITDNAAISRAHAEISVKNGVCYLIDEDSLNHTYVNGKELEGHTPKELKPGDVIRFADEEYIFHS